MTDHLSGFASRWHTICTRCGADIFIADRVIRRGGHLIHIECASGYSDE